MKLFTPKISFPASLDAQEMGEDDDGGVCVCFAAAHSRSCFSNKPCSLSELLGLVTVVNSLCLPFWQDSYIPLEGMVKVVLTVATRWRCNSEQSTKKGPGMEEAESLVISGFFPS